MAATWPATATPVDNYRIVTRTTLSGARRALISTILNTLLCVIAHKEVVTGV